MVQIEPLTRFMPYQVTVGNHENYFNYTAYRYRYVLSLPSFKCHFAHDLFLCSLSICHSFDMGGNITGGYENFYYGFDYGNVHVTSFSSELPYAPGRYVQ
jgi:hypothetical protein